MKRQFTVAALLLLSSATASTHRLDEYLQGTIFSVGKNRVDAEITLTPGVAVFPALIAQIDTNADRVLSEAEQRAYTERVLRDLSITIDGHSLKPRLASAEFPAMDDMKEGRGEIRIEFQADLPLGGANRYLTFENHHQSRIAAYQVNVLVPHDPDIRIVSQIRNYSQSHYELRFVQVGDASSKGFLSLIDRAARGLPGTIALIVLAWLAVGWGLRGKPRRLLQL